MSLSAILGGLGGSQGSGGGATSAQSVGQGNSWGYSDSISDSWSRTYGSEATAKSYEEAIRATQRQQELFDQTMAYNSQEAYAQRAFNEMMGNSIYTRSVKNMIEAGINPILAANMGLSGASVQSGAAASVSTPSAFMGQTFADQASASHSESHSRSGSDWSSESSSSGSNWQNSESGLATGLGQLGSAIQNGLQALSSAKFFDINVGQTAKEAGKEIVKDVGNSVRKGVEKTYDAITSPTVNPNGKAYSVGGKEKNTESSGGGRKF